MNDRAEMSTAIGVVLAELKVEECRVGGQGIQPAVEYALSVRHSAIGAGIEGQSIQRGEASGSGRKIRRGQGEGLLEELARRDRVNQLVTS